jgi:hypothetical protein
LIFKSIFVCSPTNSMNEAFFLLRKNNKAANATTRKGI